MKGHFLGEEKLRSHLQTLPAHTHDPSEPSGMYVSLWVDNETGTLRLLVHAKIRCLVKIRTM